MSGSLAACASAVAGYLSAGGGGSGSCRWGVAALAACTIGLKISPAYFVGAMLFRVLGSFEVADGAVHLPSAQRRLLAALLVDAGHVVTLDALAQALWRDAPPATATASLQSHLSRLRTRLATLDRAVRIVTAETGYRLEVPTSEHDVAVFERCVERARAATRARQVAEAIAHHDEALGLWRGPAWAGLADEPFLQVDAVRLDELRRTVIEERARALLSAGRVEELLGQLQPFVADNPLREGALHTFVRGLYRAGRTADALEALRTHRRLLAEELGIDPAPELQAVEREILSRADVLHGARPEMPEDVEVVPAPMAPPVAAAPQPLPDGPERKLVSVVLVEHDGGQDGASDPEDLLEAVQPLIDLIVETVHRHGGVIQSLGPRPVAALFGAPQALEGHALRACRAALEIVSAATVPVRIAVRTGEVLLRTFETDLGHGLDPVGPTLDHAHALLRRTPPGDVRICDRTARVAGGLVRATSVDGAHGDHRLVASVDTSPPVADGERPELFVGRREELELLASRSRHAATGAGQVVAIVGEAGVGKSLLARQAMQLATAASWTVLQAVATTYDTAQPYQPLVNMLRHWLRTDAEDVSGPGDVAGRLAEAGVAAADVPFLVGLLSPADPRAAEVVLSQREQRRGLHAALVAVVTGRAGPTLLVAEDLHWADRATNDALAAIVDAVVEAPVTVVATYRPEHVPSWIHRSHVALVRLRPLSHPEAHELLDWLLGTDPSLARVRARLLEWTGGSPLYLQETVRDLVERHRLVGPPGDRRYHGTAEDIQVPDSLRGVIGARVDRLPPAPRRLLQLAAVLGESAPLALLEDLAEDGSGTMAEDLAVLEAAEFLARRPRMDEQGFTFRHAIIRDTVYAQLSRERRRALHDRAIGCIRQRYGDRANDQTARLAEHAYRAERWAEAATLLQRSGDIAIDRSAHHEAAALWEQAIRALQHLPPSPERDAHEIELRAALRPALVTYGRMQQALSHLERAEALTRSRGDIDRLAWILIHTSYCHDLIGTMPPAIASGREALALGERRDDVVLQAEARLAIGQALTFAGEASAALDVLAPAAALFAGRLRMARHGMAGVRGAWAAGLSALACAQLGDLARARSLTIESRRSAVEGGRAVDTAFSSFVAGSVELAAGSPDRAVVLLENGIAAAEEEIALAGLWCRCRLADSLLDLGDVATALRQADRIIREAIDGRLVLVEAWGRTVRAACLLAGGHPDGAGDEARRVVAVARPNGLTLLAARAAAIDDEAGHM
jgi:DNA-binding SARP family transcriptional activator/tetratricopeptide (TPR) repeat protein